MKELYTEGVATHGGPELCVDDPQGCSEALSGVRADRAIEPRNGLIQDAYAVSSAEGNTDIGVMCGACWRALLGRRTMACTETPCVRTGIS